MPSKYLTPGLDNNYGPMDLTTFSSLFNYTPSSFEPVAPATFDSFSKMPGLDSLNLKLPDANIAAGPSMFDSWFGKDGKAGYANTAMNIVGGLGNLFLGYQGLQNSRRAYDLQRQQVLQNLDGQKKSHNLMVEQQYKNGLLANPNNTYGYESVADYMKKYGV